MINIILSKIIDSLDNEPESWRLGDYYDEEIYASRILGAYGHTIDVYSDRIEYTGDMGYILPIPEDFRQEVKESLDIFSDHKINEEILLAEQEIYKVVREW